MNKIFAIIQARMDSKRFPKKVLKKIDEKTMLNYVVIQTLASKSIDEVIISTTSSSEDIPIVDFCKKNSLKYYRGSKNDVLDRYYKTAKKFRCDPVVRISSDCPLIDPNVIDKVITKFLNNPFDYVSNNIEHKDGTWTNSLCKFPQGMVVEVSSFKALTKAWKMAKKPSEREHVFPFIQFNPDIFSVSNIRNKKDLSHIRCTVDRRNDLKFIQNLVSHLDNKKIIHISDIEKISKKFPSILTINNNYNFDEGYQKSLKQDRQNKFNKKYEK